MARKAPTRKPAAKALSPEPKTGRIKLDISDEIPSYYVNHIEVGHSVYDFALTAARAPAVLTDEQREAFSKIGVCCCWCQSCS